MEFYPNKCGRPAGHIIYKDVVYQNKEYIVGNLQSKKEPIYFIIDKDDFPKIKDLSWHKNSNSYLSHSIPYNEKRKELYLHNIIMERYEFLGKGQTETVDHINRIGFDNRKDNLRIVSQSEQNLNQKRKGRIITLPEDSEITANDIPKHIWYVKANGAHGERFCIQLKTENITWKTTSSKNISLKNKLQIAKDKLQELYIKYPHLNPEYNINMINELTKSYYSIIELAK